MDSTNGDHAPLEHEQLHHAQPPPPLPPTLAELFLHENFAAAARHMRVMDSGQARVEIPEAFMLVPTAPSWFLLCVDVWVQEDVVPKILSVLETAVLCIRSLQQPLVSTRDSELAGSLLFALRDCRTSIVAGFVAAYRVHEATLANFCDMALRANVYSAVQLMHSLHMKHILPVETVLLAAIQQDDVQAGDLFVRRSKEHQHLYVSMLLEHHVADKIVKKRILDFKLDANAFPVYVQRKKLSALRYLIYSEQYEEVQKVVSSSPELQEYTCRILLEKRGAAHPVTQYFVRTGGCAHVFPDVDVMSSTAFQLPVQDEYEPLDSCLSLVDCVGGVGNIVFVDTMDALKCCLAHLEAQPVVGFDCEWKATHVAGSSASAADHNPCATLQLASMEKAFVIDIIALNDISIELSDLFMNDAILKLGFDTNGDLKLLRAILGKPHGGHEVVVSNLLDVQAVVKKLYAQVAGSDAPAATEAAPVDENEPGNEAVQSNESSEVVPENESKLQTASNRKSKRRRGRRSGGASAETGAKDASTSLALTGVAEVYLGKPLDKRARMSDWERRPLTRAQLHYAAMDAHVLVQILAKMQQQHAEEVLTPIFRRCTQKNIK